MVPRAGIRTAPVMRSTAGLLLLLLLLLLQLLVLLIDLVERVCASFALMHIMNCCAKGVHCCMSRAACPAPGALPADPWRQGAAWPQGTWRTAHLNPTSHRYKVF